MTGSLWLLRHGESAAETRGVCYGALDVELSPKGVRQAELASGVLRAEPLAAVYSSPRRRCLAGARILARERTCPVETVDALAEIHFGEFEGRPYDEIAAEYPDLYREWMEQPTGFQFPGGESFDQMRKRVTKAAKILRDRHTGESIAIVTAETLALPPANIFRVGQCYGAINRIRYLEEVPLVDLVNMSPESLDCG